MKISSFSVQRLLILQLLLLFSWCSNAQTDKVVIGTIDSLESKILGEKRKVWVYVPEGASTSGGVSSMKYPVVYLLDGDAHFYSVVGMIQQLSQVNGNTVCPEMIVVGIPNTDRTRDLTPTHVAVDPFTKDSSDFLKTSGGGENFISFMEKELMPFIESKYPTAPYKMLIGHSFGGLAVMQTLVHHPQLFNSYICIDPSMWWDNKKLLNETKSFLKNTKLEGKSFYLGIANTMDEGMDINKVAKDTSVETEHIRAILELQTALENSKQSGLRYKGKYYGDDTHGSAPLITEYDALRFFFDFYNLRLGMGDFTDTTDAFVRKIEKHFMNASKQMSYKISPPESLVNAFGYEFLSSKQFGKAGSFFKLNVENYPDNANVYDSYGDYFIAIKDTANAIIQLKKALAIKENAGSRQKLESLGGKYRQPIREVTLSGTGYELGLQHGQVFKKEIGELIAKFKEKTTKELGKDANEVLADFYQKTSFDAAIKHWTPALYEEVRGIAEGAGQPFNDVMVFSLLDEFWVYQNNIKNHHCSGVGVPARNGQPAYIAQNMDIEAYTDGYQVLLRIARSGDRPEQLILTHPGCIALNGMNETGIGACMNTLMQLKASTTGLPVAFIVRRILSSTDKDDLLHFIQNVPHASGQNYIIGIKGEVYDFEASANKVVRFDPKNENGTVYHTNHPLVNDDVKPWFKKYDPTLKPEEKPVNSNSFVRLAAVQRRVKSGNIGDATIMDALRSKDDEKNPVCCAPNQWGLTFGSVIMTLSDKPFLQITSGPPDESEYKRVEFSEK